MKKERLDVALVSRGLAPTRSKAAALVLAGSVTVNGQKASKSGQQVSVDADLQVRAGKNYVSRGGHKLEGALEAFHIDPKGLVVLDAGASTGGFTDCLLQRGAKKIYAVDVGYGQLAWKLRQDERVVVMERQNIRHLDGLPEPVDLATADLSFISLRKVLPAIAGCLRAESGELLLMVKPQFELEKSAISRGGVVREETERQRAALAVIEEAKTLGFEVLGQADSPLAGPKGNVEIFLWLGRAAGSPASA